MRCLIAVSGVLSLTTQVLTQQVDPSAPPKIVSQHAQDVLSSEETSPCEAAVCDAQRSLPQLTVRQVCANRVKAAN